MVKLAKYSMGCGDRFAREASAQLAAFQKIAADGVNVVPVWNKSNREHDIIGTEPESVRAAAEKAVADAGWKGGWHVDADHINLQTVDRYIPSADFFTLDVADAIGGNVDEKRLTVFLDDHDDIIGTPVQIDGMDTSILIDETRGEQIARKYLPAVTAAGEIYRKVAAARADGSFISEVSMDETDIPQGPEELLIILAAIADEGIPAQTIAPRFSGRFNKGVNYVGDVAQFGAEFEADLLVVRYAVKKFGLPENLKLSVHSGSDKFAIYPEISRVIRKYDAGIHVKTAGTTWLEEIIGLAEAGGDGLELAKEVYRSAFDRREALCAPYAEIIDISEDRLPPPDTVDNWNSEDFVRALRHEASDEKYNPDFRQLVHVGYKVAANMGDRYLDALERHRASVAANVTDNLYRRHLKALFLY